MSHKVQKGENLTKIAKKYGLSLEELMKLNNISKDQANDIKVGQTLKISKTSTTTKPYFGNPVIGQSFLPKQSTITVPFPYDSDYTKEQFLADNAEKFQRELKRVGYNLGTSGKNKDGVDGKWGKRSQAALDRAYKDGYIYKNGRLVKPEKTLVKRNNINPVQYQVHPMFGTPVSAPKVTPSQDPQNKGYAFYISYPEHSISTKGTGYEWMGKTVPGIKGHAASIIIDENGNASYHTYGRYNDGGSYRTWSLPKMKSGEDKQEYLKRIRHKLEYFDTKEPVSAAFIDNVDAGRARAYYASKPQTGNYSLTKGITCAGEACRGIDAGTGVASNGVLDWFIPDTPENVRSINYGDYEQYTI